MSHPLGLLAGYWLGARRRTESMLRTWAARAVAELGPDCRILDTGNVYNIRRVPSAIRIGRRTLIAGELLTFAHGGEIRIGEWCYVGAQSRIWSSASIEIGDRVLISHNVNVHDCDSHPRDAALRHRQFASIATTGHPADMAGIDAARVRLEDDVWIGFNAIILKGVTVGARSVIAAGSIVTRDVPADSIVIGDRVRTADE
jgi:acetyltransferase-like isoleucine patch superfamily enzyme